MTTTALKKKTKNFFEMTDEERDEDVKQYDKPIPLSRMKPLSKKARERFERARANKPDVSIYVHDGRADVLIHLDDKLLAQASAYAKKNKTSLPKMIDRGLRGLLSFAE